MRLYTKTGDGGETGLIGGARVPKNHPRVGTYGDVDELNAALGLAVAACQDEAWRDQMRHVEDRLFVLGAELANPNSDRKTPAISNEDVAELEEWLDTACGQVPPLSQFVLPGGSELAARLHLARTVCRRAERSVVALGQQEKLAPTVLIYLNRLSDLLFAWARLANARAGVPDQVWNAPRAE